MNVCKMPGDSQIFKKKKKNPSKYHASTKNKYNLQK